MGILPGKSQKGRQKNLTDEICHDYIIGPAFFCETGQIETPISRLINWIRPR
jgi:hypothetical protein